MGRKKSKETKQAEAKAAFDGWLDYAEKKWRLMRRDPEYKKDFEIYSNDEERALEDGIYAKYDFFFPYMPDPDKTFDELMKIEESEGWFQEEHMKQGGDWVMPLSKIIGNIARSKGLSFGYRELGKPNKLTVEIDFDNINSIGNLKKELLRQIDRRIEWHNKKPQRYNAKDLGMIIHRGELKEKGLTDKDIARREFPRAFSDDSFLDQENAEKRINRDVKEYRE